MEPDFVELLGLNQSLTPSRTNGFMNMLRLMQKKTLEVYMVGLQWFSFVGFWCTGGWCPTESDACL